MPRRSLLWQIYPAFLLVVALSLVVVNRVVTRHVATLYQDRVAEDLRARAELCGELAQHGLGGGAHLAELGRRTGTRFTIVAADGRVLADSDHEPAGMENHGARREIRAALDGQVGRDVHLSRTLGVAMMYVACPARLAGAPVAVRASLPLDKLAAALRRIDSLFLGGGLAIGLLAALAALWSLRAVGRGLDELRQGASRFAAGELSTPLVPPAAAELAELADALNHMASQLDERLATVVQQRNELEAVLSSMSEGVVALDRDERVLSFNRAAARLFGGEEGGEGRLLQEVVRHRELHRFAQRALAADERVEGELSVFDTEEHVLQALGSPLRDAAGRGIGTLLVLHDITRLRRLENLRREFVANVSHELRTPITSIQGFVETLQDGALDDPEDARRFLAIIARHTARLSAIIEDLLTLSRLDQQHESQSLELEEGRLWPVLAAAAQTVAVKAVERGVTVALPPESDLTARLNSPLLEQALVNLLDNALNYSEPGSTVALGLRRGPGEVELAVVDHGCGIAPEHLPRLFERFYRADQARSRKLGGTGLGLAIVKHIVGAHGGHVSVESTPGRGSTFTIGLPSPYNEPVDRPAR